MPPGLYCGASGDARPAMPPGVYGRGGFEGAVRAAGQGDRAIVVEIGGQGGAGAARGAGRERIVRRGRNR